MSFGADFVLTMLDSNDPHLARRADQAGVNYIGIDLERIGKKERQGHLKVWISDHEESDLPAIKKVLSRSKLFVRTNPIHAESKEEIDRIIAVGAEVLMLPMFRTPGEVARYVDIVAARSEIILLLETADAAERIDEIARIGGVDEISVGLNDMRLSLGLPSQFHVLVSDLMVRLSDSVNGVGTRFGFGAVGRVGDDNLPINPDIVYAQYPRLNAVSARVSRYFLRPDPDQFDMTAEIRRFRGRMDEWYKSGPAAWE